MTRQISFAIISFANADVAHLVERHLAKVEVASSSLVIRSKTITDTREGVRNLFYTERTRLEQDGLQSRFQQSGALRIRQDFFFFEHY